MCTSCPQACITWTSLPFSFFADTLLGVGKPVSSSTGSASMSVRTSTTARRHSSSPRQRRNLLSSGLSYLPRCSVTSHRRSQFLCDQRGRSLSWVETRDGYAVFVNRKKRRQLRVSKFVAGVCCAARYDARPESRNEERESAADSSDLGAELAAQLKCTAADFFA